MFSYEHLKSFCATYEERSYSAAARKIDKDRTTIREQVKALEDSYLTELFEISGKKAHPTAFAQAIYPQAKLLVRNSERLHLRLLNAYQSDITSLDFYHDTMMPNDLVLEIEQFLVNQHPNVAVNWLHRNRDEILHAVANGHNQVAVMQHRMVNVSDAPIMNIKLGDGDLEIYARPQSDLFKHDVVQLENLQLERQYISENHYKTMPEYLAISPFTRVVSNNDMLVELVKQSGWALLTESLAAQEVAAGKLKKVSLKELTTTGKFGLSFFYPLSFESTSIYQGLLQTVQSYAKRNL